MAPPDVNMAFDMEKEAGNADSAGQSTKFVLSVKGYFHRLPPHGDSGPVGAWATACGWKFGGSTAQIVEAVPEHVIYKRLCAKCLPKLWEAAKQAFIAGGAS